MRPAAVFRVLPIALLLAAWFALTNHCALAALSPEPAAEDCPMHSQPVPKKQESAPVCCKIVRAVSGPVAAEQVAPPASSPSPDEMDFTALLPARVPQFRVNLLGLDTGPPGAGNFAESVLQQSLLAHAPPSLG
jgi:hypothetical protein